MKCPCCLLVVLSACLALCAMEAIGAMEGKFIFDPENPPTPECHASTIVETEEGLVAAWFAGTREKNPDVTIWLSRHGGSGWSAPEEVADGIRSADERYACWNPVLFQWPGGDLVLFYKVGVTPKTWWGEVKRSSDAGRTWSAAERLPEGILGPIKNKPVLLRDGRLVAPSSTEHDGWRAHFEITSDPELRRWEIAAPVNQSGRFDAIQPTVFVHSGSSLQALCRSKQDVLVETWSHDGGATWSALQPTALPNPSAGADGVTLADGRHLLIYNPLEEGRGTLALAISEDGRSWQQVRVLENEEGQRFSYPAIIQAADGGIHITYTWKRKTIKHVALSPEDL